MNNKKFEKEFPELIKNKMIFHQPEGNLNNWFIDNDVYNNCLDKQKVKEAITKMVLGVNAPDDILIECQNYIYKELGLQD